jgi:uncharacterized protein
MKNIAKKLFCLTVALLLTLALPLSVHAQTAYVPYLQDEARVLDDLNFEGQWMDATLSQISNRLQLTVAVTTVHTLDDEDIDNYTAHYYRNADYAYADGVLLLVAMEEREWYIYTTGDAYDYLTDAALDDIEDAIVPFLRVDNYFDAFRAYAELCDKYLTMGQEGNVYRGSFPWDENIVIALIVGAVVALIVVSVMKSKLKSVRPRREAHEYTRPGSMNVTTSRDLYLYRTVHRRPKPKDSGSSGGRSGGGSRSGGRGGSF